MTDNLPLDPLERYEFFRNNRWAFLVHCIYTKDEVDAECPIKRYPAHFDYARFITLMFDREKKIAIPKSRRMTVSWTILALITHDLIFFKGRNWAVTSRKEEAAKELISRIEFMIAHIPQDMIPKALIPKMKNGKMQTSPPTIEFEETYSKVQGHPQGGNQLRQYGFSGIFEDECAFQEESEETYAAAEPTVRGGGRFIKVSSRAIEDRGFFKKIVFDRLDATDIRFPEIPPVPPQTPMEGVQVWKNPRNSFLVIDLHYTANPAKRGEAFREALKRTLPARRYAMEYERSWMTYEGRPVYEDFNVGLHSTQIRPEYQMGLPLLLGWDSSGLTPACVVGQLQEEQLVIFREVIGEGMGAQRFVPLVESVLRSDFPGVSDFSEQTVSFFDPAGFRKNEITEETYIQRMAKHGFSRIMPGPQTWKARVDAVTERLTGLSKGLPDILIYENDCPIIIAGFKGGFRYSDKIRDAEPDKPQAIKDQHCVDAETEILTVNGWKTCDEIEKNDAIYEYDIEKNIMIKGSIVDVIRQHNTEGINFIRLKNSKHDIRFTSGHRCVIKHKESKCVDVILAHDLKQGHLFFGPPALREGRKKKQLSDNIVELAAWIMTEGTLRKSGSYILSQSTTHNPHHVEAIDRLVSTFPDCFRKNNYEAIAQWHIRGNAQFMLNKLLTGKNKIPSSDLITGMNNTQRRLFIYTAMCGDGDCANKLRSGLHFARNEDLISALPTARIRLQHKKQIDALQVIATLCGLNSSVLPCKDGMWSFTISKVHQYTDIQNLGKTEHKESFAWCVQSETGTWIMRRNGHVYVTGNSHPHDALQYLCGGLKNYKKQNYAETPAPKYGFQRGERAERGNPWTTKR